MQQCHSAQSEGEGRSSSEQEGRRHRNFIPKDTRWLINIASLFMFRHPSTPDKMWSWTPECGPTTHHASGLLNSCPNTRIAFPRRSSLGPCHGLGLWRKALTAKRNRQQATQHRCPCTSAARKSRKRASCRARRHHSNQRFAGYKLH